MIASPDRRPAPDGSAAAAHGDASSTGSAHAGPTIVALVAHAREVPSLQREAFADVLRHLPEDSRWIVLRTCHRVELYGTGEGLRAASTAEPAIANPPAGMEVLTDVEAVRHLVSVASGLDSAVFGETQILHQLRETLEERHVEQRLDPLLERLFQAALRTGRAARSYFTGSPRSLADVALDRIAAAGPDGSPVLVVGVGRMARLAALAASRRGHEVIVTNRTASRAVDLAGELGGRVLPFGSDGALPPLAGVVIAIAGKWPLGPADLAGLAGRSTPVVDLSSPPAVDAETAARLGANFISVDDLARAVEDGPDERTRRRVERLVSRAGGDYCQWLRSRDAVPAIRGVVGAAEARRADEMAWLQRRLPALAPEDLAIVEQMSHRLVAAMLHAPLSALTSDDAGDLEQAARELFGL